MKFPLLGSIVAMAAIAAATPSLAQEAHGGGAMAMPMTDTAGAHGGHSSADLNEMVAAAPRLHEMHMTAEQHAVAHSATIHAAMVALDIDPGANISGLRNARDEFNRVLAGLRHGDEGLGLPGFSHPAILGELTRVERIWARYDVVVQRSLERSDVTDEHIAALAAIDPELHDALNALVETAEYYSYQGRGFTILTPTVRQASNLHIVLQDLVAKYLLAAHGDSDSVTNLTRAAAEFEHLLRALTHGDSELRVLGAPTDDIAAQFAMIDVLWRECWTEISRISGADRTDADNIVRLREHIDGLVAEVDEVVDMYHFL